MEQCLEEVDHSFKSLVILKYEIESFYVNVKNSNNNGSRFYGPYVDQKGSNESLLALYRPFYLNNSQTIFGYFAIEFLLSNFVSNLNGKVF